MDDDDEFAAMDLASSNAQDRSSDKTSNAKNSSNSTNRKGNTQCK